MNNDPASPVCYAEGADDIYMGYAGRDEILSGLNELLEAGRAGARVTLESWKSASDPQLGELMRRVHQDEARWCAMLSEQIRKLGGTPSSACGAFYEKAMAIDDPMERIRFLNRGQDWVVRKLAALMRRIRSEALYAELRAMHESHQSNISLAEQFLS